MQRGKQAHVRGDSSDHFPDILSSVESFFSCPPNTNETHDILFCCAPKSTTTEPPASVAKPATTPNLPHNEHPNDHHAQDPYRSTRQL